jgi:hypothetical protein
MNPETGFGKSLAIGQTIGHTKQDDPLPFNMRFFTPFGPL